MKESNLQAFAVKQMKRAGYLVLVNKQKYERGWPDLICFKYPGETIFIELKTGTKTTKIQDYMLSILRDIGFNSYVAESEEDIEQIIGENA